MLSELRIRNIALVDELNVSFSNKLNVLTGETGAGKSVIVGAIMLLLGERADSKSIREGADTASVEGAFNCHTLRNLNRIFESRGIEPEEDGTLIIRRVVSKDGHSKCYINGQMTTLSVLKEVGDNLVDVHSQNDHQSLLRKISHLEFLDSFGGTVNNRTEVADTLRKLKSLEQERVELNRDEQEKERVREIYEFQIEEIDKAGLTEGEDETLRDRKKILTNAERLHELVTEVHNALEDGENSATDMIRSALKALVEAAKIDSSLEKTVNTIESALANAEEAASEVRDRRDSIEYDDGELENIEARLNLLFSLKRKYGNTIEDILRFRDDIEKKLRRITHREEEILRLDSEITMIKNRYDKFALALSEKRKKYAASFSKTVEKELRELGMEHGRFIVRINPSPPSFTGNDDVEFLISPNLGEKPKSLRDIASSGEISRVMLAIKTVLGNNDDTPVLIFDEIDVNIGGETAVTVGSKLSALSEKHQVICITHLPQVAKFADRHFNVLKSVQGKKTLTEINALESDGRIQELARMLGASPKEKTGINLARKMLELNKTKRRKNDR